ncbi:MAG: alpha/beta fold hydrolase [Candidatus Limnocylindrus sp.]
MPTAKIRGAEIHFDTYGELTQGRDPILLIHGSYITGSVDWGGVAPSLAEEFHVIVPDCRGHGRSSDPAGRYSFREMAADAAELIRTLGHRQAHVIGHSNGGNVALVTLMEHPEVVASCIPQAANAYVSRDLVERIPKKLDPERVRAEDPSLMSEMIELHSARHGADYWATLLRRTAAEIVSEPNYTALDLSRVQRSTLVIEGELDATNSPAAHGRFIAQHIPGSQLWIPAGIGHNVHAEIPAEWCERVLNFVRGTLATQPS